MKIPRIQRIRLIKKKEYRTNLVALTSSEAFKIQYEQISANIRSRDNMSIVSGTILITASVVLLASFAELVSRGTIDFNIRIAVVTASLAIYSIWLLGFDMTTNKIDDMCYSKLRKMEREADPRLNIHFDMRARLHGKKWYEWGRRKVWLYLFWVLILLGVAILKLP